MILEDKPLIFEVVLSQCIPRVIESKGQKQSNTISISHDNFGERKTKFNLGTSRTTQMQLYKCIHVT
jgi:hypothetical protein